MLYDWENTLSHTSHVFCQDIWVNKFFAAHSAGIRFFPGINSIMYSLFGGSEKFLGAYITNVQFSVSVFSVVLCQITFLDKALVTYFAYFERCFISLNLIALCQFTWWVEFLDQPWMIKQCFLWTLWKKNESEFRSYDSITTNSS